MVKNLQRKKSAIVSEDVGKKVVEKTRCNFQHLSD